MSESDVIIDGKNLYREEVFTDLGPGMLRSLTPVRADGLPDPERKPLFQGMAWVESNGGMVPIRADIPADSLAGALAAFPSIVLEAAKAYYANEKEPKFATP